jgi:hypothetical protein
MRFCKEYDEVFKLIEIVVVNEVLYYDELFVDIGFSILYIPFSANISNIEITNLFLLVLLNILLLNCLKLIIMHKSKYSKEGLKFECQEYSPLLQ